MRRVLLSAIAVFALVAQTRADDIASVVPNEAFQGDALGVTITGNATSFGQGNGTVVSFAQGSATTIYPTTVNVITPEELDAFFEISTGALTGYYDVSVTEVGIETSVLIDGFKVKDASVPCGDTDGSGLVDIDDVVYLINYIFLSGPEPVPYESGDVDCTSEIDIDDVVYIILYIFAGGNAPCEPYGIGMSDCFPTGIDEVEPLQLPTKYVLSQNYPNPFNLETVIEFALPQPCRVRIDIFNILGQRIRTIVDELMPAGTNSVSWDGSGEHGLPVTSGLYFYRILAREFVETKKMIMLK